MARKGLRTRHKILAATFPVLAVLALLIWYLHDHTIAVLEPAGEVGQKERNLLIIGLLLSAIVVIPVYAMAVLIAWKYRASNIKAKYTPDWDHSRLFESLWWGIPIVIISILSVITWNSSHALDPFKALSSTTPPLTVQVVSLDWKWLFIYPSQHIASVNLAEIPVNTPIAFQITSDTVMNSFWVPQLGGQIYAMPGMDTQLHLIANKTGNFAGSSANISGQGFADMAFTTRAVPQTDFNAWVHQAQNSSNTLTATSYAALAQPTDGYPVTTYALKDSSLYNDIIMRYAAPETPGSSTTQTGTTIQGMYMQ